MEHHIRQHVVNQFGLKTVKVETVRGELGSRVYDKNGREIFENDILQYDDGEKVTVEYELGAFCLSDGEELINVAHIVTVVGHV